MTRAKSNSESKSKSKSKLKPGSELLERVKRTISRYRMLDPGELVLVAVSGGVDSIVLLHVLFELRDELGTKLAVAHLDHRIRPESGADAAFVGREAEKLGLPLIVEARDVPAHAKAKRLSLEEAAREVRYRFLEEAARRLGAQKIALGHHRDDLAETILLNLIRGAGPVGLRGMAPVRGSYIRPLIECSREEIEAFARERGLEYRLDRTNLEIDYLRNRIRLELLPLLERYRPQVAARLAQTGLLLGELVEFIEGLASARLEGILLEQHEGELVLDRKRILQERRALRGFILREAIRRLRGGLRDLEFQHLRALEELITREEPHAELHLPGGVRFRRRGERLIFMLGAETETPPEPFEFPLHLGENLFPEIGWRFHLEEAELEEGERPEFSADPLQEVIDRDRIEGQLILRSPRPGDRLRPLGMAGTKKLQDLFVDEKVPREERARVPLVCDQRGIIWVVGLRLSEDYKVTLETRRALVITASRLGLERDQD